MKESRSVLVPIDSSASSDLALARAIAMAVEQQAEIHVVHAIERTPAQPAFGIAVIHPLRRLK
ncbi:MAG: universal stress protein [Rhodanobacter sp.]|nr:MAG: universal stress protein [Rhodanobacter sp.]TAL99334.1 MAG: universal stress protein [Rhodanobacter sp.]TAM38687.1 MAG: universal stress protein [Rhodanobacter sp.]TAN23712.1 MAG: universal stress protein [Rhodanobacter sp.]